VFVHKPLQQLYPAAHVVPHVPQFVVLVCRLTQDPPQQDRPAPHELVHDPQLVAFVWTLMHEPVQHSKPVPHALPHVPQLVVLFSVLSHELPQHVGVGVVQVRPQKPQFVGLPVTLMHVLVQQLRPAPPPQSPFRSHCVARHEPPVRQ
jgi:hypothetical protein